MWEEATRAVADVFAKKAGVDIRYVQQANTREGIAKIRAQKDNPQVDVVFSTADALQQAFSEKLVVPINRSMPNVAMLPKSAVRDESLDIGYILFGLAYRKDLAPFEIKRYEDLLDPRLKGRVASPTASFSSGRWLVQLALANGGSERNIEPAFEFLRKLKPNITTFVVGTVIPTLQSGEAAVSYLIFSEVAKLLGPDSAYRFVLPEGKAVITSVLAVGLPNPKNELGQKFVDYMASARGPGGLLPQDRLLAASSQGPAARGAEGLPASTGARLRPGLGPDQQEPAGLGRPVQEGDPDPLRTARGAGIPGVLARGSGSGAPRVARRCEP